MLSGASILAVITIAMGFSAMSSHSGQASNSNFIVDGSSLDLQSYCHSVGGEILTRWTCPASKTVREGEFCQVKSAQTQNLVFNGCTSAMGDYSQIFFKACVVHDLCYHHEPATTGKNKADCDRKFLKDMNDICKTQPSWGCTAAANSFFFAVDNFGGSSWSCSKEKATYPSEMKDW